MNKTELAGIIRKRRADLKITQSDLAEITGIGVRTLKRIENGEGNITLEVLTKVLGVLGLKIEIVVKK
ncbi:MAG: helix-turn-helix domain-containing protein [Methanococcaceae archaeon]